MLPQVKNPDYIDYYLRRKDEGDILILDNGEYEDAQKQTQFMEMMDVYRPQVAVLPDYLLQDGSKTVAAAIKFLDRWGDKWGNEWMFVPQSVPGDIMGFIDCLYEGIQLAEDHSWEAITWIGIPRALPTKISQDPLIRVNVCRYIKEKTPQLKVHCLGMAAGNLEEVKLLGKAGCDAIDSSAPVWRGWNGYDLESRTYYSETLPGAWRDVPCNFDAPFHHNPFKHELILKNLEACGVNTTAAR